MNVDSVGTTPLANATGRQDAKLREACQDFEAVFLNHLLKSMRKTVMKSELFGSSKEEEFFQEMMDYEVSRSIAKRQSMGIADMLYKQLRGDMFRQNGIQEKRGENG